MIWYLKILNQKTTKLKFSLILSIAIFNKLNINLSLWNTLLGVILTDESVKICNYNLKNTHFSIT